MNRAACLLTTFDRGRGIARVLCALMLIGIFLAYTPLATACGPFSLQAVFAFRLHPGFPLERYAAGDIGIVRPTFARSYLYVAHRHLAGTAIDREQQQALVQLWQERLNLRWDPNHDEAIKSWNAVRTRVVGGDPPPEIEVYRYREKPNEYQTYLNCQNDAFTNAAATLEDRISRFGTTGAVVRDWVAAQDQVFTNCSVGKNIPGSTTGSVEPLVRADREYQIAAANFYASDFAEAEKSFRAIANDKSSPWQKQANYLIARTLVRQASLGPAEGRDENLRQAENELKELLSNSDLRAMHDAARRLLNLVRLRLYPEIKLRELGESLLKNPGTSVKQDLWDYTLLLDKFLGDDSAGVEPVAGFTPQDELTEWIVNFQAQTDAAREHAFSRWREKASTPWLIAALDKSSGSHPELEELLSAAANITPGSAAFPTASFHIARLLIDADRLDQARQKLDELLTTHGAKLRTSAVNLLLEQRLGVARNLDEFLRYSPRLPAGVTWDEDGRELPAALEQPDKSLQDKTRFDVDAVMVLNRGLPLEVLKQAVESEILPEHLRRDLAQATWLRAVMLGEMRTADALVPTVRKLIPETVPLLAEYLSAPEALKRYAGIYLWLKFPGFEPVVDVGLGRQTSLGEQDTYRDNWWCSAAYFEDSDKSKASLANFTTAAQRQTAEKQFATLLSQGAAPNYLASQVIQWAERTRTDRRVPEALHLVVRSTRYGCGDKETGKWSKAAFDLLHKRYPRSVWAQRTPHWFKQ